MLTRVKMYGVTVDNYIDTVGFEVTYQAWPRDEFVLYPTKRKLFGSK